MADENSGWKISKSIPMSVVILIVGQIAASIWFFGGLVDSVGHLEEFTQKESTLRLQNGKDIEALKYDISMKMQDINVSLVKIQVQLEGLDKRFDKKFDSNPGQ